MSYMQEIEAWLDGLLVSFLESKDAAGFKRAIKLRLLESYRNGQQACPKCAKGAGKEDGR
jgi:hypothetical protein